MNQDDRKLLNSLTDHIQQLLVASAVHEEALGINMSTIARKGPEPSARLDHMLASLEGKIDAAMSEWNQDAPSIDLIQARSTR